MMVENQEKENTSLVFNTANTVLESGAKNW